jgi:hypothetical protein
LTFIADIQQKEQSQGHTFVKFQIAYMITSFFYFCYFYFKELNYNTIILPFVKIYSWSELSKMPIKKGRNELLDSLRPVLRGLADDFRTLDWVEVKETLQFTATELDCLINLF